MKSGLCVLLLAAAITFCCSFSAICQFTKPAKQDKAEEARYNRAIALADQAKKTLLAGDFKTADSLVRASITIYPTGPVMYYAKALGDLSDIKGANLIMDTAIDSVKNGRGYKGDPFGTMVFMDHTDFTKIRYLPYDPSRAFYRYIYEAYKVNVTFGHRSWQTHSLQRLKEPVLRHYPANYKFPDLELENQRSFAEELEVAQGNYDKAIQMALQRPSTLFYTETKRSQEIRDIKLKHLYDKGDQAEGPGFYQRIHYHLRKQTYFSLKDFSENYS